MTIADSDTRVSSSLMIDLRPISPNLDMVTFELVVLAVLLIIFHFSYSGYCSLLFGLEGRCIFLIFELFDTVNNVLQIMASLMRRYSHARRGSSLSLFQPSPVKASPIKQLFLSSRQPVLAPLELEGGAEGNKAEEAIASPVKKETKKSVEEPICDLDDIPKAKKVTSDIKLPDLPPLPDTKDPGFRDALVAKFDLINTQLNFEDTDSDLTAKEVRLTTINQIFNLSTTPSEISKDDRNYLFDALCQVVFRDVERVRPEFMSSDDLVTFTEPQMGQLSLCYQSILNLMPELPERFDLKFVYKLMDRFYLPDTSERNTLSQFVCSIVKNTPEMKGDVLKKCCNILIDYLDKKKVPHVLLPCMTVICELIKGEKVLAPYTEMYKNYILLGITFPHFNSCSERMQELIELFIEKEPSVVIPTLQYLLRHFPQTRSNKTIALLNITAKVVAKISQKEFKVYWRQIFDVFMKASCCPQIKVVTASYAIWKNIAIEPMIMDNARKIFPIIYPLLMKALNTKWSSDIETVLNEILSSMNRIDSFVFQDLCRQKGPKAAVQTGAPTNDRLKNWATIARGAARTDRDMNLALKLAEIQKTFSPTQQPSSYSSVNAKSSMSSGNVTQSSSMKGMHPFPGNRSGAMSNSALSAAASPKVVIPRV